MPSLDPFRNVSTSLWDGIDESLVAQDADRASGRGARDLVGLDQLALGWDTGIGRVLTGQNPALEDVRYLSVGRYRGKRVNPVNWHMINFSCRRSSSYIATRIDMSQ